MEGIGSKILAGALLLAGASTLVVIERSRQRAELAGLEKKIAALSVPAPPAAEPPPTVIYRTYEPSAPASTAAAASSPAPAAPAAEPPKPAVSVAEARDSYEIAFGSDHPDPGWTAAELRRTNQKVQAALPEGSELKSLDCRASLCRIETSHADLSRYRTFVHSAFMDPATQVWNAATFSTRENDGAGSGEPLLIVSYVAREGQDLPRVE